MPLGFGKPSGPKAGPLLEPGFGPGIPRLFGSGGGRLFAFGVAAGAGVLFDSDTCSAGEAEAIGPAGVADEEVVEDLD